MKNAAQIFGFLLAAAANGECCALITITGVSGGSPRAPGTHMAVSETGAHRGSISGGCVEAAIIGEARRVIASGKAEQLRLGVGSRFIDIILPCGGSIDILITPSPAAAALRDAADGLAARRPVLVSLGPEGGLDAGAAPPDAHTGWHSGRFQVRHDPDMRLIIAGHGEEVLALTRLGIAYNIGVTVLSPDDDLVEAAAALGADAWPLQAGKRSSRLAADPHSAVVLLFHDHAWELDLLIQALQQPAFFIGAMGSRTTHSGRLRALAQHGMGAQASARLTGPIGLITPARDADTLALSALAQIVDRYHAIERQTQPLLAPL
jgi:xanthine dehydrogenase accessory factor